MADDSCKVTQEDIAAAIDAVAHGATVDSVAEHYGVEPLTVYRWLEQSGAYVRDGVSDVEGAVYDYVNSPQLSLNEICVKHHIGSTTLYRTLTQRGIPKRSKMGLSDEDAEAAIVELYTGGMAITQIRRRVHKGFPFVYAVLQKHGLYTQE